MSISPWAMLITFMTPKVIDKPRAVRIRIELTLSALNSVSETGVRSINATRGRGGRVPGEFNGRWRLRLREAASNSETLRFFLKLLDLGALGHATFGPVATPTRERYGGIWIGRDQVRPVDDLELLVVADLAH